MNGSQARKVVILIVLAIAFVELGVTTKFGSIWQLAFQGNVGDEPAKPLPKSGSPSQSATAHATTNAQNNSTQTY